MMTMMRWLQELGPIAVYSDWDGKSGHGLGKNFPQFASSVLAGQSSFITCLN